MDLLQEGHQLYLRELMDLFPSPGKRFTLNPSPSKWKQHDVPNLHWFEKISDQKPWDLYIHIPFCKSICTFCGCNIKTAEGHEQEGVYIDKVLHEWSFYQKEYPDHQVENLFIGGGTPNALSIKNLVRLLESIETSNIYIELNPQLFNEEQAKALAAFNLKRVTFGIQDTNQKILENVNRTQELENIKKAFFLARQYGLGEIAADLIYGLPLQNQHSLDISIKEVLALIPDFIHLYPLAHVPWQEARQRAYGNFEVIPQRQKNRLYELGANLLSEYGYQNLGFNSFVHTESMAFSTTKFDRNICDIAHNLNDTLVGLGVSSISSSPEMYVQNHKILEKYLNQDHKEKKHFPLGHLKTKQECHSETIFNKIYKEKMFKWDSTNIEDLLKYGILKKDQGLTQVTEIGLHFLPQLFHRIDSVLHSNN